MAGLIDRRRKLIGSTTAVPGQDVVTSTPMPPTAPPAPTTHSGDMYGWDPTGTKHTLSGPYDKWGVYMGLRGAPIAPNRNFLAGQNPSFNQWTSGADRNSWIRNYIAQQRAKVLMQRPDLPQGGPGSAAFRQGVHAMDNWRNQMAMWGANPGDMGILPKKGGGLHAFNYWNQDAGGGTPFYKDWANRGFQQAAHYWDLAHPNGQPAPGSGAAPGDTSGGAYWGNGGDSPYLPPATGGGMTSTAAPTATGAPSTGAPGPVGSAALGAGTSTAAASNNPFLRRQRPVTLGDLAGG